MTPLCFVYFLDPIIRVEARRGASCVDKETPPGQRVAWPGGLKQMGVRARRRLRFHLVVYLCLLHLCLLQAFSDTHIQDSGFSV